MILGLDEGIVRSAVAGVRDEDDDAGDGGSAGDGAAVAFARAAWSGIAEPGDGVAGALIAALGPVGALQLVIDHADPDRVAAQVSDAGGSSMARRAVLQGLARWRPRLVAGDAIAALQRAAHVRARLILPEDAVWPSGLVDLAEHSPVALWARGELEALPALERSVAVVGARMATKYGETVAAELVDGLVAAGVAIVSGGAYGIDGMAHRAALACGGTTVAFLAGGVDRFYPPRNSQLLAEITRTGAVLSELPVGATPTRWRFLQRNRLIAASSSATVVVEAGTRSGSINTAGHAATIGRPLGAVPGPVTSPASAGCHRLLRDYSAVCVTESSDILALLGGGPSAGAEAGPSPSTLLDPVITRVLDAVGPRGRSVETIAKASGLAPAEVSGVLGLLELDGAVAFADDGWRRVRQSARERIGGAN